MNGAVFIMDNYFGFRQQVKNYYLEMALAESHELARLANRASAFYLKNAQTRFSFRKEIDDLINRHVSACRAATSQEGQRNSYMCLRAEKNALQQQYTSLQLNRIKKALYIEITNDNGILTYFIKGIGLIAGVSQLVAGAASVIGSRGRNVTGYLLISHGANNIYENGYFLINGEDDTGPVRDLYRMLANKAGYDNRIADIVYGGVDLALSVHGLFFTKKLVSDRRSLMSYENGPDTLRLYGALDTDFVMTIKTMGKLSLGLEIVGDMITISGVWDNL